MSKLSKFSQCDQQFEESDIPDDPLINKKTQQNKEMSMYLSQEFSLRIGTSESSSSVSLTTDSDNKDGAENINNSSETHPSVLLHPNSATTSNIKKKHYKDNIFSRLIRRKPKKKAGCAYEKRLSLEIKAAKTVAIVTGCFIFCWLGFSILYGLSSTIQINEIIWSIVFWLGYLNSALNPVIYTVFNREFRTCFKRLLTCNHMIFKTQNPTSMVYLF